MYSVEIVWNREFNWVPYGEIYDTVEEAKQLASRVKNSGDGARVKKAQVINADTGEVVLKSHEI